MNLMEGGNIWDDVATNFDPSEIGKPLAEATFKYLKPLGASVEVIGSCWRPRYNKDGSVVRANDLDAMVDLDILMNAFNTSDSSTTRRALAAYLNEKNIQTKLAGVTVHARIPLGGNFYQVDIKVVKNAKNVAQYHRHEIPQGSPYKGVNKQLVMNALASSQNMLWSPDEGLYARDSAGKKAQLLSSDWNTIAQYLLGKNATGKDLGSVESILAKVPPERQEEIMSKARAGHSWQAATPNVTEWFRRTLDMLK
jgi:hypothetical protein